jgi:hypothetical protein
MKNISETMWSVWESGDFTGNNRPMTRAEISKNVLKGDTYFAEGGAGRTILFDQEDDWVEVPNIQNITIARRLGQDAAQMEMILLNQVPISVDTNLDLTHAGTAGTPTIRQLGDLGAPGFYTFRRGMLDRDGNQPWGHGEDTTWVDMFIPNRVIRTFQGYGTDGAAYPSQDTNLALTGIWLIDAVEYTSKGSISIRCRDLAKLLIEQRLYPPIIPLDFYPLEFCAEHEEDMLGVTPTSTTSSTVTRDEVVGENVGSHVTSGWDSSTAPWYGYNASLYGHRASHAFDGDPSTYWLSVGNSGPNKAWSYEWIEANTRGEPVNQVYFKPWKGGYVVYVAVKVGGVWQGTDTVPYGFNSAPAYPNGSNVKYVKKVTIPSGEAYRTIDLTDVNGAPLQADSVRLIFTNLQDSNLGTYQYRAGVYDFQVRNHTLPYEDTVTTTVGGEEYTYTEVIPGNMDDYTDIVKVLCAWSGFWWPQGDNDATLQKWGIPSGRVWGDFMYSGAYPVDPPCIPSTFWDNKSVMDGINQIKEILGFICYVDTTGGVVWRPPNIWRTGNYVTGVGYVGEDTVRTVDENRVLIDYGVTIDDTSLRSEIVVVSSEDPTISAGFIPTWGQDGGSPSAQIDDLSLLGGQQRVMLVPNYPFVSPAEVEKFGFLVSLWIHWSYRNSRFRIPGNPAFEPDDQIRIYERVSSELYIHYIQGISSVMDMNTGTWYMDIDTHWLGNGPDVEWVVDKADLEKSPLFIAYLIDIGQLSDEVVSALDPSWWQPYSADIPPADYRQDPDTSLYPALPDVVYPDVEWDPDNPSDPAEGTVWAGGNDFYSLWWGPGPRSKNVIPGNCNPDDIRTYKMLYKWNTAYGSPYWEGPALEGINTHVNQTKDISVSIDRRAESAFRKMFRIICEEEYYIFQAGGYDCRGVNILGSYSATNWSTHSWGVTVDINPSALYQGKSLSTVPSVVKTIAARVESIKANKNGVRVFRWGGRFGTPDAMHFEIICKASDLVNGVT